LRQCRIEILAIDIEIGHVDAESRFRVFEIECRAAQRSEAGVAAELHQIGADEARRTDGFGGGDLMELCRNAGLAALRRSTLNLEDPKAAFRIDMTNLYVDGQDFDTALAQV